MYAWVGTHKTTLTTYFQSCSFQSTPQSWDLASFIWIWVAMDLFFSPQLQRKPYKYLFYIKTTTYYHFRWKVSWGSHNNIRSWPHLHWPKKLDPSHTPKSSWAWQERHWDEPIDCNNCWVQASIILTLTHLNVYAPHASSGDSQLPRSGLYPDIQKVRQKGRRGGNNNDSWKWKHMLRKILWFTLNHIESTKKC